MIRIREDASSTNRILIVPRTDADDTVFRISSFNISCICKQGSGGPAQTLLLGGACGDNFEPHKFLQLLKSGPEGHGLCDELELFLKAFEATVRSSRKYKDIIKGPQVELQRWFSQHRLWGDVWRVSEKGLLQALQLVQEYVADDNGELATDDREGEAISAGSGLGVWNLAHLQERLQQEQD